MKKIVIFLFVAAVFLSFSCNKYCHCKRYIDGELDPNYKKGEFVKESQLGCEAYSEPLKEIDGVWEEVKCK